MDLKIKCCTIYFKFVLHTETEISSVDGWSSNCCHFVSIDEFQDLLMNLVRNKDAYFFFYFLYWCFLVFLIVILGNPFQVFEVSPFLSVVEMKKAGGDTLEFDRVIPIYMF